MSKQDSKNHIDKLIVTAQVTGFSSLCIVQLISACVSVNQIAGATPCDSVTAPMHGEQTMHLLTIDHIMDMVHIHRNLPIPQALLLSFSLFFAG